MTEHSDTPKDTPVVRTLRAIPVARDTAAMPPRPAASTSPAAHIRRARSFSSGATAS